MAAAYRGIALLIGNSEYEYLDPLENALKDVKEISRRLKECGYELILAENLNVDQIKQKVSNLKDRLNEDQHREVLVYYAGHGLIYNEEHYLVERRYNDKAEIKQNEINRKCISVDRDIIGSTCEIALSDEGTRSIVIILDACRSMTNPIARGDLNVTETRLFGSIKPRHELKIGVLVGYACALKAGAFESESGKNGVYTDCILQNIFVPGENILDGISNANNQVAERTNFGQTPYIYVNNTKLFRYSLMQGAPVTDEPSRTLEQEFQLAQIELAKLRLEKSKMKISDMDIVEKLYENTQGALWKNNKDRLSWQVNSCTSEFMEADGRITYIDLYNNNLTGIIPQELGRLSYLTFLDLSCNELKGVIPVELGKLLKLEDLNLRSNQLTGAIPVELGSLSELKKLWLNGNQLTGAIPVELGNLLKLEDLNLRSNQLTGEIPVELGELKSLVHLGLHNNQLTGDPPVVPGCYIKFHPQRL